MKANASEVLKNSIPKIIQRWESRVLEEITAARHENKLALQNSLYEYLSQLSIELSQTPRTEVQISSGKSRSSSVGREHGKSRAKINQYTIDQLIYEYHILRQVICAELEEQDALSPEGKETIVANIEQAVNDAATEYSDTLRELRDQLSHTLAHDLRNPLATALNCAEMILRKPEDKSNCIDKASRIISSVTRIDRMIRDLLDAAKASSSPPLKEDVKSCDLDWIIRDVALEFNMTEPNKVDFHSSQPQQGYWNEDALRRIVENLVKNAIKFGDRSSTVSIDLSGDERTTTFSVHNEGSPLSERDQEKIFKPFFRSEGTRDSREGWGIGLTAVKSLVEEHQGEINLESLPGKGTTFSVSLPRDLRNLN